MERAKVALLVVLLLGAGYAVTEALLGPHDPSPKSPRKASNRGYAPTRPPLFSGTPAMRRLGIARASFTHQQGTDPRGKQQEDPLANMSPKQRQLLEKFRHGNLSRIGNATVFNAPDKAKTLQLIKEAKAKKK